MHVLLVWIMCVSFGKKRWGGGVKGQEEPVAIQQQKVLYN